MGPRADRTLAQLALRQVPHGPVDNGLQFEGVGQELDHGQQGGEDAGDDDSGQDQGHDGHSPPGQGQEITQSYGQQAEDKGGSLKGDGPQAQGQGGAEGRSRRKAQDVRGNQGIRKSA